MKNLFRIDINPNRIYGLDILRALAILFVILGHSSFLVPDEVGHYLLNFTLDGVNIFFVLSGFLIGGILLKQLNENKINSKLLGNFWIRRWFRTLPNYLLVLIILLILNILFTPYFEWQNYKSYFIFSQNLFSKHPGFFPEAWSLSIEEWFYLLIPILLFGLIKLFKISIKNSFLISALGIIISVTFFRYFRFDSLDIEEMSTWGRMLRKQVFTRLDSIMFGVIGAYILYYYPKLWNKNKLPLLLLGIILLVSVKLNPMGFENFGLYHCVFSFSLTSIGTLLLLPFLSSLKTGKGLVFKTLTYTSLISYSMYLVNLTLVQKWILGNLNWTWLQNYNESLFLCIQFSLFWILVYLISILLYKYFELPTMKLRERFKIK